MYRWESWTEQTKEDWALKNQCLQIVALEKTLESPLDFKENKTVNPKENRPWIFIGRTDVKLKPQYFGHLMQRDNSLEKTLMLGKIEGKRRRQQQRMSWLNSITDSVDMDLGKLWDILEDRGKWLAAAPEVKKSQTQLSGWTTITRCSRENFCWPGILTWSPSLHRSLPNLLSRGKCYHSKMI